MMVSGHNSHTIAKKFFPTENQAHNTNPKHGMNTLTINYKANCRVIVVYISKKCLYKLINQLIYFIEVSILQIQTLRFVVCAKMWGHPLLNTPNTE